MTYGAIVLFLFSQAVAADSETEVNQQITDTVKIDNPAKPRPVTSSVDTDVVEPLEVIVVWGKAAITQARYRIVSQFKELGYRKVNEKDNGDWVFAPNQGWKGKVILTRDGFLKFKRPIIGISRAYVDEEKQQSVTKPASNLPVEPVQSGQLQFYFLPSMKRLKSVRRKVRAGINPQLIAYRQVIIETSIQEFVEALPKRLDALWQSGTPLIDDDVDLSTPTVKRLAILNYWATRPDSREGRLVAKAVNDWMYANLVGQPNTLTLAEQAEANAKAIHGLQLELVTK